MSYFHPIYASKHTVIAGLGTIHSHTVGSCSHTTGHDHYFLAEGAEKPVPGVVRFSAYVTESGEIAWRFVFAQGPLARKRGWQEPRLDEHTQIDFPAAAVAEMRRLSETLHERDHTAWFFSAIGAIDMELNDLLEKRAGFERTVSHLGLLLSNPNEPKQHFVSAKQAGQPKGFFRDATDAERQERRDLWTRRREAAANKIAAFDAEQGDRVATLQRLRAALRTWSGSPRGKRLSPFDIHQAALAA